MRSSPALEGWRHTFPAHDDVDTGAQVAILASPGGLAPRQLSRDFRDDHTPAVTDL
ncbi:hypothetical protein [Actinopolyspora mortivallis]|uniref:hypothetical protein n=1 Tax=Actinopolyspora mortivallis TaxID=33906 RepID=UPI001C6351B4|nr:hypothetical protein [Actinopolyspora mortivallis]